MHVCVRDGGDTQTLGGKAGVFRFCMMCGHNISAERHHASVSSVRMVVLSQEESVVFAPGVHRFCCLFSYGYL